MAESTAAPIDKSTWGDGPWQAEPDRLEWTHAGLRCLAVRGAMFGNWCGYAAVPPGHPLHGQDEEMPDVDVHGGLTYSAGCSGDICHIPPPGEPDDVWWFGFDCGHAGDLMPGFEARQLATGLRTALGPDPWQPVYRTLDYVREETNRLAEQLAAVTA